MMPCKNSSVMIAEQDCSCIGKICVASANIFKMMSFFVIGLIELCYRFVIIFNDHSDLAFSIVLR